MKKLISLSVLSTCMALSVNAQNHQDTNTYHVGYHSAAPVLDGKFDEEVWGKVTALTDFTNPWVEEKMPATSFKAYHDGEYFYFGFDVEDPNIVAYEKLDDEWMVARQDRVELFFAQAPIDQQREDGSWPNYFALEMDYHGRTLSIKADSQKNRDADWNMETLEAKGVRTDKGYTLEGRIALAELDKLGVIHDNRIQAGAYRAEFSIVKGREKADWITWVNPQIEKPNFHINSSFGQFILEEKAK